MQPVPVPVPAVKNIQTLYLNPHGADIWFIINDERIPAHKLILSTISPYYATMFYGSLPPENNEVNMTEAVTSVESFKEFLKFMYMRQPNLNMNNIEDVISLAKQSLSDECLSRCAMFLKESLTTDNVFRVYQLAILYDIGNLKATCEDEICVFAETILQSSSLLGFPYEYLLTILRCDSLACDEVHIFMACMAWAKAACKRNNLDASSGKALRAQLRVCLHEIRFTSMTKEEASRCIQLHPGLFTADELEEIICMVGKRDEYQRKQFNWTPRYFNLTRYKGRYLQFSIAKDQCDPYGFSSALHQRETTRFSCNRRVLLNSFYCHLICLPQTLPLRVIIKESQNNENVIVRYDQESVAHFKELVNENSTKHQAEIVLNKSILLRPKYHYDICIEFVPFPWPFPFTPPSKSAILGTKKRIDHDIVFQFDGKGIVCGLSIYRFDNKNFVRKVFYNPKTWIILGSAVTGVIFFKCLSVYQLT